MSNFEIIKHSFEKDGARLTTGIVGAFGGRSRKFNGAYRLDVVRDEKGEHFELMIADDSVEFAVVSLRPKIKHLIPADHKTTLLPFWHQIQMSREVFTRPMAFLD